MRTTISSVLLTLLLTAITFAQEPSADEALKVANAEIASLRAQLAEVQQSLAICQLPGVIETHAASIAAQRHACEVTGGQFQQGQQGLTCTPKPKPAKPGETK